MSKKLAVISLGCDKNRVDTERMLSVLSSGDFIISEESEAEIIIINTCAFINSARKEAIDTILSTAQLKTHGKLKKLIVTGCLPQKHMDEIKDSLTEVDAFLGVSDYDTILDTINKLYSGERVAVNQGGDQTDFSGRKLTTNGYAYLKIADGCDNHCTYCTIPSIRGKYRSRSIDSLVSETNSLVQLGVKEIILVAQDVTNYGADLFGRPDLVKLLKELSKTNIQRIRLMYCYPSLITDELIAEIKTNQKIAKYLDIPLQHVHDEVLKRMGRKETLSSINALIGKLLTIKGIALRTTFMVGFPGETDEEFAALLDFVNRGYFRHVGIFSYSDEDTPSKKLSGKVSLAVKRQRHKTLAAAQQRVVTDYMAGQIGGQIEADYEGIDFDKGLFVARPVSSAPDVDPVVYFTADFVEAGSTVRLSITGAKGYDYIGEYLGEKLN